MSAPASALCPHCQHSNPAGTLVCPACHKESHAGELLTQVMGSDAGLVTGPALPPGTDVGGRYEILSVLGSGGMGTVYKAHDRGLDRTVALKVVRPELAAHPQILHRFKQEIILARQVSHRNVIRLYDLGIAPNLVYITMDYIEGEDLATYASRRKLSVDESIRIVRQICQALDAAHGEGVMHRDLKPQNIMISAAGKVSVMDFGLARSIEEPGMTQAGVLLGTPTYMSPEQAEGRALDSRSDLFAVGIIFYELLSGKIPFEAETMLASLVKRTREAPEPLSKIDSTIPAPISNIVSKCLAIDPANRFQTAAEVLQALDAPQSVAAPAPSKSAPGPVPPGQTPSMAPARYDRRKAMVAFGAMLLGGAGTYVLFRRGNAPAVVPGKPHEAVSLLVADFQNETGDPVFDGTLEPMLNVAIEGAGFVTGYSRGVARDTARKLRISDGKLNPEAARLVAISEGLDVVVSGKLTRSGTGYDLALKATDARTGKTVEHAEKHAENKEAVLAAIPALAMPVRKALGDSTPPSVQLSALETFTTSSVEAVHLYAQGQELAFNAKYEEARRLFAQAAELDPGFGRAYASMAVASLNLGQRAEGERYFKLAMSHLDRMTLRERYRTRGAYYIMVGAYQKGVEEFSTLVSQYPSDTAGLSNLAYCYTQLRNLPAAIQQMKKAVAISPRHALLLNNLALYSIYAGDIDTGEKNARAALEINPSYGKAFVALAFEQIQQGKAEQAAETYRKLLKIGDSSRATAGLADLAIYQGRFSEAARMLEESAEADRASNRTERAAMKLALMAEARLQQGDRKAAQTAAEEALKLSNESRVKLMAGRIFTRTGAAGKARSLVTQMSSEATLEPQTYGQLLAGEILLSENKASQAVRAFQDANKNLDTWLGRFSLGLAYLAAGAVTEADSEFDRCVRRRGEASSLFLDEFPTAGFFPAVYYYLGQVREKNGASSAEAFEDYLAIRGSAPEDRLAAQIQARKK